MVNLIKDSERGDLMAFDTIDVPFYVKRVFVINNVPIGNTRGKHAHIENEQMLICINGVIDLWISKNGITFTPIRLLKGDSFLINKMVWAWQYYSVENSELMVLCSHEYDKNDYITDFEEFKRLTQ